jgi:hypothetical protein
MMPYFGVLQKQWIVMDTSCGIERPHTAPGEGHHGTYTFLSGTGCRVYAQRGQENWLCQLWPAGDQFRGQGAASGYQLWMVRQDTNKKNDAANRTRTCDMLVNSPDYESKSKNSMIHEKRRAEKAGGKPDDSGSQRFVPAATVLNMNIPVRFKICGILE